MNCVGKLADNLVVDKIQEYGGALFHHGQNESVKGRSVLDILYNSVQCVL